MVAHPRCCSALTRCLVVAWFVTLGVALPMSGAASDPRPVRPSQRSLDVPPVAGTARDERGRQVVAERRSSGTSFDVVGVTADAELPPGAVVEVRTRGAAGWSRWTEAHMNGHAADDDSPDGRRTRERRGARGSEPVVAAGSDAVEVRVVGTAAQTDLSDLPDLKLHLVDGKESAADARAAAADAGAASADGGAASADVGAAAAGAGAVSAGVDAATSTSTSTAAAVAQPSITTRAQWGADESIRSCEGDPSTMRAAVVHHTAGSNSYTQAQVPGILRGIYAYHVTTLGWCDIGYQFLVDRFGRIYEGRYGSIAGNPSGAHARGFNSATFGVASIGDNTSLSGSSRVLDAYARVIAWKAALNGIDPVESVTLTSAGNDQYPAGSTVTVSRVTGHRALNSTACPGGALWAQVPTIRARAGAVVAAAGVRWRVQVPQARQPETFTRPRGATIDLRGRGVGHGRGMSQWGAHAAAQAGLTHQEILGFYYPSTVLYDQGDPAMRVELSALGRSGTQVLTQPGLSLHDGIRVTALAQSPDRWRIAATPRGLTLQWRSGGLWQSSGYWKDWTRGPLTFGSTSGTLRTVLPAGTVREYAGSIATHRWGSAGISVNIVSTEQYTASALSSAMAASWPSAALKAQAVAVRTQSARSRVAPRSSVAHTCDAPPCQLYPGRGDAAAVGAPIVTRTDPRVLAAITETAETVAIHGGRPAVADYSPANGGRTAAGGQPYLPAKTDPYDGVLLAAAQQEWTSAVPVARVEQVWPAIGTLSALSLTSRSGGGDWGGRAAGVTLRGSRGSVSLTPDQFRAGTGVRGSWWTVTSAPAQSAPARPRDLTGERLPDVVSPTAAGGLEVLSADGRMAFPRRSVAASGFADTSLATGVGAFDGDITGDVVARAAGGELWLYPGDPAGALLRPRVLVGSGFEDAQHLVSVGDVSGDRLTDIVEVTTGGRLRLHRGDGRGGLSGVADLGTGMAGLRDVAGADLDGDGTTDLVAVRASDGALLWWAGSGAGAFAGAARIGTTDWRWTGQLISVGDLTGDGRHDLLVRRASDGVLGVYPVTGRAALSPAITAGPAAPSTRWG
ncbi:MAG: FG-GAP-like repeat-containing protein [Dermatophilaceae bacterium]